jgi:hypothetical protein
MLHARARSDGKPEAADSVLTHGGKRRIAYALERMDTSFESRDLGRSVIDGAFRCLFDDASQTCRTEAMLLGFPKEQASVDICDSCEAAFDILQIASIQAMKRRKRDIDRPRISPIDESNQLQSMAGMWRCTRATGTVAPSREERHERSVCRPRGMGQESIPLRTGRASEAG